MHERHGRPVTIDDIRAAADRLRGVALATPLVPFTTPDGRPILLKAESLQPIGAFKIRGAYNAIARLDFDVRARGVVASSSGNHAQGVARAARLLGVPATVFMPADATAVKLERVRADGADGDHGRPARTRDEPGGRARVRGNARDPVHPLVRQRRRDRGTGDSRARDRGGGRRPRRAARAGRRAAGSSAGWPPRCGRSIRAHGSSASNPSWRQTPRNRSVAGSSSRGRANGAVARSPMEPARTSRHGPSPTSSGWSTTSSPSTRPRSRRPCGCWPNGARLVVEPTGALAVAAATFRAAEAGLTGIEGSVVALVSGGNVDPDRYREYLEAPIPEPR